MRTFLLIMLLSVNLWSDINSTLGKIQFDVNHDGNHELIIKPSGVGVLDEPTHSLTIHGNAMVSEQVNIGGITGQSNLHIHGSLGIEIQKLSVSSQLDDNSVVLVDTSSGNLVIELPEASLVGGRMIYIKKSTNENQLWVSSSNLIDGKMSHLEMGEVSGLLPHAMLISDGETWYVLNHSEDVQQVIAAGNLTAWWKFNERSGEVSQDFSLNDHHGELLGAEFSFSSNGITGKVDRALSFNGSSDYVEVPYSTSYNTENFTVSFWAKLQGGSSYRSPIASRVSSGAVQKGYIFYVTPSNQWQFWTGKGSGWNTSIGVSATTDVWTFISGTYDGTTQKFYINGDIVDSDVVTFSVNDDRILRIGAGRTESTPNFFFPGEVDDVRIYNRALTDTEIMNIYSQEI